MSLTFNPNGGDLGRALIKSMTALELELVIPHVAGILEDLAIAGWSPYPFKYAFEVHLNEKEKALSVIESQKLPNHVSWYEIEGRKLFELRGVSGGVTSAFVCYLVTTLK